MYESPSRHVFLFLFFSRSFRFLGGNKNIFLLILFFNEITLLEIKMFGVKNIQH